MHQKKHILKILLVECLVMALFSQLSAASTITLNNGDRLSGSLETINLQGNAVVRVSSSPAPIEILGNNISKIEFARKEIQNFHKSELITLINGDEIPCSITSLDQKSLRFHTLYAGEFTIPTLSVRQIEFHTTPEKLIYTGPLNQDEWTRNHHWKVTNKVLSTSKKSDVGREFDLPSNFTFKCKVKWESSRPQFKIWFCGDSDQTSKNADCYFMDFNPNSIHIARSTHTQEHNQFGTLPMKLKNVPANNIDLELKVDRKSSQIIVIINNKFVGVYHDNSLSSPMGNCINFESSMQNGNSLEIKNIKIHKWSGNTFFSDIQTEKLSKDKDTIFDNEGLSYTGELVGIKSKGHLKYLSFASGHALVNLKVPLDKLQSIHFQERPTNDLPQKKQFNIMLHGGGSLRVTRLNLTGKETAVEHPILGSLKLKTAAVSRILSIDNDNNE